VAEGEGGAHTCIGICPLGICIGIAWPLAICIIGMPLCIICIPPMAPIGIIPLGMALDVP
jgi:hypothetical protein